MRKKRIIVALGISVLLFGIYSVAREKLVPFSADFARATWLLAGDEPAYLLAAQAITAGDGENVRNVNTRRSYTNFQTRPIIGDQQWTWEYYKGVGTPHLIDRGAGWRDKQVIYRPPLIALFK